MPVVTPPSTPWILTLGEDNNNQDAKEYYAMYCGAMFDARWRASPFPHVLSRARESAISHLGSSPPAATTFIAKASAAAAHSRSQETSRRRANASSCDQFVVLA